MSAVYVNHPRTRYALGDIVRNADDPTSKVTWARDCLLADASWIALTSYAVHRREELPERLVLLVDGETGHVVR